MLRVLLCLVPLLLLLEGCGEKPPPRGFAQDQAAGATARSEFNAKAADDAALEAARAEGEAAELQHQAETMPTAERIRLAADARVRAASAKAVADASDRLAKAAAEEARKSTEAARQEREADAIAADLRRWVNLCRWFGLAGVAAGALLGGLLCWFVGPKVGVPAGALIAGTGLLVVAFGATVTWLPLALAGTVVVGLLVWAVAHQRTLALGDALSQTVDALEGKATTTLDDAKKALGKAVGRSGLKARLTRARARWKPA